ncbi:hypothetical protein STEG23_008697, partial [Scotinomys teguina]
DALEITAEVRIPSSALEIELNKCLEVAGSSVLLRITTSCGSYNVEIGQLKKCKGLIEFARSGPVPGFQEDTLQLAFIDLRQMLKVHEFLPVCSCRRLTVSPFLTLVSFLHAVVLPTWPVGDGFMDYTCRHRTCLENNGVPKEMPVCFFVVVEQIVMLFMLRGTVFTDKHLVLCSDPCILSDLVFSFLSPTGTFSVQMESGALTAGPALTSKRILSVVEAGAALSASAGVYGCGNYLNYFSIAVKRHHDQGNLKEKEFIGPYSFRGLFCVERNTFERNTFCLSLPSVGILAVSLLKDGKDFENITIRC